MNESNLFDIARDDEMLDALAGRSAHDHVADLRTDPLFVDLSLWTAHIDQSAVVAEPTTAKRAVVGSTAMNSDEAAKPGRHRRRGGWETTGRRSMRAGFAVAAAGAALSFSGVAAAVNGGRLPTLPSLHFPTADAPAHGGQVLADVPSAVPTSPSVLPERGGMRSPNRNGEPAESGSQRVDSAAGTTHSSAAAAKSAPAAPGATRTSTQHAATAPDASAGLLMPSSHVKVPAPAGTAAHSSQGKGSHAWKLWPHHKPTSPSGTKPVTSTGSTAQPTAPQLTTPAASKPTSGAGASAGSSSSKGDGAAPSPGSSAVSTSGKTSTASAQVPAASGQLGSVGGSAAHRHKNPGRGWASAARQATKGQGSSAQSNASHTSTHRVTSVNKAQVRQIITRAAAAQASTASAVPSAADSPQTN